MRTSVREPARSPQDAVPGNRLKISVCMATRDGERYLGEQLATILPQLGPDDELIISDDSSSDGTLALIDQCRDPRIRVLAGNRFFSPILNFENALGRADGDIVVLADQDDIWLEDKLALIRERFRRAGAGPPLLLVLDGEIIDGDGKLLASGIFAHLGSGPGLLKNIYDNSYMGCCLAFSRQLLTFALPFPRRIPMHDMWLGLLAELVGRVEFVAVKTIRYRKHAASATPWTRRFLPWLQIKRRFWLSWYLAGRYLNLTRSAGWRR